MTPPPPPPPALVLQDPDLDAGLSNKNLKDLFRRLDLNGNGYLSKEVAGLVVAMGVVAVAGYAWRVG